MKKLMSLMLGLSLVLGSAALVLAQDTTKTTEKTEKTMKKKGAKKTTKKTESTTKTGN
jgi:hypothetical protein